MPCCRHDISYATTIPRLAAKCKRFVLHPERTIQFEFTLSWWKWDNFLSPYPQYIAGIRSSVNCGCGFAHRAEWRGIVEEWWIHLVQAMMVMRQWMKEERLCLDILGKHPSREIA
jgi:hypothetical protein